MSLKSIGRIFRRALISFILCVFLSGCATVSEFVGHVVRDDQIWGAISEAAGISGTQTAAMARNVATGAADAYTQYNRVISNLPALFEDMVRDGLRTGLLIEDPNNADYRRIYIIFNRVLESDHLRQYRNQYNWRILLENNNDINAGAAMNGYIFINTGFIEFARNDEELAMLIGHEIAHVTKRHTQARVRNEEVRRQIVNTITSSLGQNMSDQQMFNNIFGFAGSAAVMTFHRDHEVEADREGAKYAASVGYDPDRGNFWTRFSSQQNPNRFEALLRTHPYSQDRARAFVAGNYRARYYNPNFNHAARNAPDLARAYNLNGIMHFNNGNFDRAVADFTQAARLASNDVVIRTNLGHTQFERGDHINAVSSFEAALRIDPNNATARQFLERPALREAISNNNVTLINSIGHPVNRALIRPSGTDDWGGNLLSGNLQSGYQLRARLPRPLTQTNRFDIALRVRDNEWYIKWNVLLTPDARIEFTRSDYSQ